MKKSPNSVKLGVGYVSSQLESSSESSSDSEKVPKQYTSIDLILSQVILGKVSQSEGE